MYVEWGILANCAIIGALVSLALSVIWPEPPTITDKRIKARRDAYLVRRANAQANWKGLIQRRSHAAYTDKGRKAMTQMAWFRYIREAFTPLTPCPVLTQATAWSSA